MDLIKLTALAYSRDVGTSGQHKRVSGTHCRVRQANFAGGSDETVVTWCVMYP